MTSKLTITRERLQEIAEDGFLKHGESKILARMALAAMDSEPVKRVNADQMHHVCLEANRHLDKYGAMAKEVNKLLGRIPAQPAPVVPDEKPMPNPLNMYAVDAVAAIAEVRGWNACRAAMLQAGNYPVIPDGYVMVPKEPTAEMIWAAKYCFTSTPGCDVFKSAYIAMLATARRRYRNQVKDTRTPSLLTWHFMPVNQLAIPILITGLNFKD
ncbi:TPA: hypothetical protein ACG1F8_005411 [Raoultella planticola]